MRLSDTISLATLIVILSLLLHGARHGPIEPMLRAVKLAPTPPTAVAETQGRSPRAVDAADTRRALPRRLELSERSATTKHPPTVVATRSMR